MSSKSVSWVSPFGLPLPRNDSTPTHNGECSVYSIKQLLIYSPWTQSIELGMLVYAHIKASHRFGFRWIVFILDMLTKHLFAALHLAKCMLLISILKFFFMCIVLNKQQLIFVISYFLSSSIVPRCSIALLFKLEQISYFHHSAVPIINGQFSKQKCFQMFFIWYIFHNGTK